MSTCRFEGQSVTSDMPGYCRSCSLYLNTCVPVINSGYFVGSECDLFYCNCCTLYIAGECDTCG